MLNVPNYSIDNDLRKDRQDTAAGIGGGLIVYVRNDVTVKALPCSNNFNQYCQFDLLSHGENDPLNITLVYRSPNSTAENTSELAKLLENCAKKSLFIGDFNLPHMDIANGTADVKGRPILEAINQSFLVNSVDFATHVRGNTLDLALSNIGDAIVNTTDLGPVGSSDHSAIKLEIDFYAKTDRSSEKVRDWRRGDEFGLKESMENIDFDELFQGKNANDCWEALREQMDTALNRYIPLVDRRNPNNPPWFSAHIKKLTNRKRRHWQRYKKDRTTANYDLYKQSEKDLKKSVQSAKRAFEKKIAKSGNKRPFNFYIKSKSKARVGIGPLKVNGELVTSNQAMACALNDYFVSVFTEENSGPVPTLPRQMAVNHLTRIVITSDMVEKKINALKPSSAPGPDGVTPRFLRLNSRPMSRALAFIFNLSLQTGVVPYEWKTANVTPIHKKGSKSDPGNYRPVSLTCIPCKLQEACIKDAIMEHLLDAALIKDSQHGFMSRRSCTTNLLQFLERVTTEVDMGRSMDVIYLDFSKAFDKVPHRRLIEKFKSLGIGGEVVQWIEEWLRGRKQRTVLNGEASDWSAVLSGVPQGSVLGPLAFIVFINDIDGCGDNLITLLSKFADDTKLGQVIYDQQEALALQSCLDNLEEWAEQWGMSFNIAKCKVMHTGRGNPATVYTMSGRPLTVTDKEKDIGVTVQCNLRPTAQCAEAAQRANAVLGQISRSFHYRDRHTFRKLYMQYVRPHLEFAAPAWSPWTQRDIDLLESVQQRAVRMISGLQATSYAGRLAELGMLSLQQRRILSDMVQVYKIIHGLDRVDKNTWFDLAGDSDVRITRATSDPLNILPRHARNEVRKNFFSVRVANTWNSVPADIKRAPSVSSFRRSINNLLSSNML